MSILGRLV